MLVGWLGLRCETGKKLCEKNCFINNEANNIDCNTLIYKKMKSKIFNRHFKLY